MSNAPSGPQILKDQHLEALCEQGWTCWHDVVELSLVEELAAECLLYQAQGALVKAGTGRAAKLLVQEGVRSDRIAWWHSDSYSATQARYALFLEALRLQLNMTLYLGLQDVEMHYAVYGPGAFYRRHLDQFRDQGTRKLSLVFFLNEDWARGDGGQLRLYVAADGGHQDIYPCANTAVLFRSDLIEHEVLPTKRNRLSIPSWFRQRKPH